MRCLTSCSGLITAGIFFFYLSAVAQTTDTTSIPIRIVDGLPVVQVTLNGKGPYDFILDTGDNNSAAQRQVLAQLAIPLGDPVVVSTTVGDNHQRRAVVESIGVGSFTVLKMELDTLDQAQLSEKQRRLSGVLGEDFLKHFDILLDNEKKTLVLDRTSRLAESLIGEEVPFSRFGSFNLGLTIDRIIVELKMPSYLSQSLRCLIDSGANVAVLFPEKSRVRHLQVFAHSSEMIIPNGDSCMVERSHLIVGRNTLPVTEVFSCGNTTREASDVDCLLPTHLFKQIFISHTNSYIIFNPQKVSRKPQELANTLLSAQ